MSSIKQPPWHKPRGSPPPALTVNNSLTKKKEEFIPEQGKRVSWYCCGPTVYDKSHMGHARAYITFDILRRILEDYFNYDVTYVMNITDIDDKIIIGARHKHLFDGFKAENQTLSAALIQQVKEAWSKYVTDNLGEYDEGVADGWDSFTAKYWAGEIPISKKKKEKGDLYVKTGTKTLGAIKEAEAALAAGKTGDETAAALLDNSRDIIAAWLDAKDGSKITEQKLFRDYAAYWENDFFTDMDALNIRRPDVLTRVSEYVPENIEYVEKIIANGYGYEVDGSVYFDTVAFGQSPNHDYAKLEPWSAGNEGLAEEGEGALSKKPQGKRNPSDFVLWKRSKAGEPFWPSPWGPGRPGWHIECSAMASEVLGQKLDIHTGGIDLAFPHHDNELAQAEAYFDCHQWVNYFLHAGHLHIEGQKMSKSLKNFITIRDALQQHSASQIRIMYLLHQWDSVLDYGAGSMTEARALETTIHNFLANVKAVVQEQSGPQLFTGAHNHHQAEKDLLQTLETKQALIHAALCDSFNTPLVMQELRDLISVANTYYQDKEKAKQRPSAQILGKIGKYVTKMMRTFGVFPDANVEIGSGGGAAGGKSFDDAVMPYLQVMSTFRDNVRELAQTKAEAKEFLKLSDKLRDEDCVELGVVLDDREGGKALVKLVDKEVLLKQREEKRQRELEKQREKEERARVAAQKRAEKLAKGKVPPSEMFKDEAGRKEYSAWDEQGIPTKDIKGEPLSKSKRKNLEKEHGKQGKLHEEYLAWKATQDQ
ncbi:hypothetical protein HK104_000034 [Borealophlyctis nickersoniae]|nr:hypothetical protein HK104_000034 [Borealophlyctis nickersoniae]